MHGKNEFDTTGVALFLIDQLEEPACGNKLNQNDK